MKKREQEARVKGWIYGLSCSTGAKLVTSVLLLHRNFKTRRCDPLETTLARELHVNEKTVRRYLQDAVKAGLVKIEHHPGDRNSYIINDGDDWAGFHRGL